MKLDHERLDVYQASLDFAVYSFALARQSKRMARYSRDQLWRASQSIALNIAEAWGKLSSLDRRRFLQLAGGSARECAAILDIQRRCDVISDDEWARGKALLSRIVAMLTRMIGQLPERVRESEPEYGYAYEYDHGVAASAPLGGVVRSRALRSRI